jgi:hypothetical protein
MEDGGGSDSGMEEKGISIAPHKDTWGQYCLKKRRNEMCRSWIATREQWSKWLMCGCIAGASTGNLYTLRGVMDQQHWNVVRRRSNIRQGTWARFFFLFQMLQDVASNQAHDISILPFTLFCAKAAGYSGSFVPPTRQPLQAKNLFQLPEG